MPDEPPLLFGDKIVLKDTSKTLPHMSLSSTHLKNNLAPKLESQKMKQNYDACQYV